MSDFVKTEPGFQSFLVKSQQLAFDHQNKMPFNFEALQVLQRKEKMSKRNSVNDQYRVKEIKPLQAKWSRAQDQAYIKFIKQNSFLFDSQNLRRTGRVFMRMSLEMNGMRTPNQCKSHHQKMQKVTKGGSLKQIIVHLTNKYAQSTSKDIKTRETDNTESQPVEQDINQNGHRSLIVHLGKKVEIRVYVCVDRIEQW